MSDTADPTGDRPDDAAGDGSVDGDRDGDGGVRLTKEQVAGDEEVPKETQQAIEEERRERLDEENRPEGAEIDNSDRDFDVASGRFTDGDSPGDDDEVGPFNDPTAPDGEVEA